MKNKLLTTRVRIGAQMQPRVSGGRVCAPYHQAVEPAHDESIHGHQSEQKSLSLSL